MTLDDDDDDGRGARAASTRAAAAPKPPPLALRVAMRARYATTFVERLDDGHARDARERPIEWLERECERVYDAKYEDDARALRGTAREDGGDGGREGRERERERRGRDDDDVWGFRVRTLGADVRGEIARGKTRVGGDVQRGGGEEEQDE